jgi:hypothetical protein
LSDWDELLVTTLSDWDELLETTLSDWDELLVTLSRGWEDGKFRLFPVGETKPYKVFRLYITENGGGHFVIITRCLL